MLKGQYQQPDTGKIKVFMNVVENNQIYLPYIKLYEFVNIQTFALL